MLGRGAKYFVPIGIAFFAPNSVVFAAENPNPPPKPKRTPWDVYCDPGQTSAKAKDCTKKPAVSELEKCIQKCREDLGPIQSEAHDYLAQTKDFFKGATSTVLDNVKFLQTEASDEVKMATIAGGSLVGFLLGIRKSFFKKLLYAAILGTATTAVIYPKETKVVVKEGSVYAKTNIKSLYNQLLGSVYISVPKIRKLDDTTIKNIKCIDNEKDKEKGAKCESKPKKPKKEGKNNASTSTT